MPIAAKCPAKIKASIRACTEVSRRSWSGLQLRSKDRTHGAPSLTSALPTPPEPAKRSRYPGLPKPGDGPANLNCRRGKKPPSTKPSAGTRGPDKAPPARAWPQPSRRLSTSQMIKGEPRPSRTNLEQPLVKGHGVAHSQLNPPVRKRTSRQRRVTASSGPVSSMLRG